MKSKLINEIIILLLLSIVGYSFLTNFDNWNNTIFKFIVDGYAVKSARVVSFRNFDNAGYSYSEANIQLDGEISNRTVLLKSDWLNKGDKNIIVYVNSVYPELITPKSNFVINIFEFTLSLFCFILWIKYGFNFLKKRVIM